MSVVCLYQAGGNFLAGKVAYYSSFYFGVVSESVRENPLQTPGVVQKNRKTEYSEEG